MPEHVHLLVSEPAKGDPSKVLQVLKQKVSRALHDRRRKPRPEQSSLDFPPSETRVGALWQRRFYDFNVWSSEKLKEKLEYMHANPVKRKLVVHPKDWPWSSWGYYTKGEQGLIRIDPLGAGTESLCDRKEKSKPAPLHTKGCGTQHLLAADACATRLGGEVRGDDPGGGGDGPGDEEGGPRQSCPRRGQKLRGPDEEGEQAQHSGFCGGGYTRQDPEQHAETAGHLSDAGQVGPADSKRKPRGH
jgi:REP element-mobilizing transposase RayT